MKKKQQSPIMVLLGLAADSRGKFVESVVFAVIGVIAGVVPYLAGARIIVALMSGNKDSAYYGRLCLIALLAYILKVLFANVSTTVSHSATYQTLRSIRLKMISKLSKMRYTARYTIRPDEGYDRGPGRRTGDNTGAPDPGDDSEYSDPALPAFVPVLA